MTSFRFDILDHVTGPMRGIAASFRMADRPLTGFRRGLSSLVPVMNRVQSEAGQTASGIKGIGLPLKGLTNFLPGLGSAMAGAFAVDRVFEFGRGIVDTLAKFERFEAVLTNTLGDNGMAKAVLADIKQFAATTPFQVDEITDSFVKLANRGFAPNMRQMTMMGDLAASTGKNYDLLVEAMLDAETGEFERLKEFGIKASKQGDRVRLTFKGITKEVGADAASIREHLLSLGNLEGVEGSMAAISKTTGGMLSNLGDQWTALKLGIGQAFAPFLAKILPKLTDGLTKVAKWVENNQDGFREWMSSVRRGFEKIRPFVLTYWQSVTKLFKALVPIIANVGRVVGDIVLPVWKELQGVSSRVLDAISGFLVAHETDIRVFVNNVGEGIKTIIGGIALFVGWAGEIIDEVGLKLDALNKKFAFLDNIRAAVKFVDDFNPHKQWMGKARKEFDQLGMATPEGSSDKKHGRFGAAATLEGSSSDKQHGRFGKTATDTANADQDAVDEKGGLMGFLDKFNSQFASGGNGKEKSGKGKGRSPISDGLSSVTGGGGNVKHITINIQKLVESLNINTTTLGMGKGQVKSELERLLLSVVNDVNYQ